MDTVVVGLCGPKKGGKDTVAQFLIAEDANFVRGAFADKLKAIALALDPYIDIPRDNFDMPVRIAVDAMSQWTGTVTHERLSTLVSYFGWDLVKDLPDGRRLLQRLGTEVGRREIDDLFWVNMFHHYVTEELDSAQSLVITDVRFTNEIDYVRQVGGYLWRINRPEAEDGDPHPSEREWRDAVPDLTIENTGTLEQLGSSARTALRLTRQSDLNAYPPGFPIIRTVGVEYNHGEPEPE